MEATIKNHNRTFTHRRKQWGCLLRKKHEPFIGFWEAEIFDQKVLCWKGPGGIPTWSAPKDQAAYRCWVSWVDLLGIQQAWSPEASAQCLQVLSTQDFPFLGHFTSQFYLIKTFTYDPIFLPNVRKFRHHFSVGQCEHLSNFPLAGRRVAL